MEYAFALSAATPGGRAELVADAYPGGALDWHAFDGRLQPAGGTGGETVAVEAIRAEPSRRRGWTPAPSALWPTASPPRPPTTGSRSCRRRSHRDSTACAAARCRTRRDVRCRPHGRVLEPDRPLALHEEEVPRAGARVTRASQYARWIDGSTHLWIGRRKQPGRGEGSSGLRFDIADPA